MLGNLKVIELSRDVMYGAVRCDRTVMCCVEWTTFTLESSIHAISSVLMDGVLRGFKSMEVTRNLCFDDHCSP